WRDAAVRDFLRRLWFVSRFFVFEDSKAGRFDTALWVDAGDAFQDRRRTSAGFLFGFDTRYQPATDMIVNDDRATVDHHIAARRKSCDLSSNRIEGVTLEQIIEDMNLRCDVVGAVCRERVELLAPELPALVERLVFRSGSRILHREAGPVYQAIAGHVYTT